MRKVLSVILAATLMTALLCSCSGPDLYERLNSQASEEYLQPIRPASEGRNPCWNKFAKKFMYAPAFDVPAPSDALSYRFTVSCGEESWSFETKDPHASLAPIWEPRRALSPAPRMTTAPSTPTAACSKTR